MGPARAFFSFLLIAVAVARPHVKTSLGLINGKVCADNKGATEYLSVRYAKPPVGSLRFTAPQRWTEKYSKYGYWATKLGARCPDPSMPESAYSEDCLFVDIYVPANATSKSNLPVRVFLHGGGYQSGSAMDPNLDGCAIVNDARTILVTVNYRLGAVGFLALPELKDSKAGGVIGNWGLLDQRMALEWIQKNIKAFGGDPKRVLFNGESAGAYSVLLHTVSPGSRGLFSRVASYSGSSDVEAVDFLPDAYAKGAAFAESLGCTKERAVKGIKACLQSAPLQALLASQQALSVDTMHNLIPVIDGVTIPEHPRKLYLAGKAAKVPIHFNVNNREGSLEFIGSVLNDFMNVTQDLMVQGVRTITAVPDSFLPRVIEKYHADNFGGSWLMSGIYVITEAAYFCPSYRVAKAMAARGNDVYFSVLHRVKANPGCDLKDFFGVYPEPWMLDIWDTAHTYDMAFTFMLPYWLKDGCDWTEDDRQLASFMSGIVAGMAFRGAPAPAKSASLTYPDLKHLDWPSWSKNGSAPIMKIDVNEPGLYGIDAGMADRCELWDELLDYQVAQGTLYAP